MINKSSLLTIQALSELAQLLPGECAGVVSIAKKIDAPANYLGKLLQSLVAYGLVVSQKGKGGGFQLKKPPDKVSLYDVITCIEDVDKWSRCFLGRKQCLDTSPCSVHDHWKIVRDTNLKFLQSTTLYDLSH